MVPIRCRVWKASWTSTMTVPAVAKDVIDAVSRACVYISHLERICSNGHGWEVWIYIALNVATIVVLLYGMRLLLTTLLEAWSERIVASVAGATAGERISWGKHHVIGVETLTSCIIVASCVVAPSPSVVICPARLIIRSQCCGLLLWVARRHDKIVLRDTGPATAVSAMRWTLIIHYILSIRVTCRGAWMLRYLRMLW